MPPKKNKKKHKPQLKGIQQIVNVNVSKTIKNNNKKMSIPKSFSKQPINSFSLVTPQMTTPSFQNEYNMLLREITNERKQALNALQPLAPNTAPLTQSMQKNELFSKTPERTMLSPLTETFAMTAQSTIKNELYDDPLTDDNNLVNSSRLQENVAQKLPVMSSDVASIEKFADENAYEQTAMSHQAVDDEIEFRTPRPNRNNEARREAHARYIDIVNQVNHDYGLNIPIRGISKFTGIKDIDKEVARIRMQISELKG